MAIRMIALDQDKTTLDKEGKISRGNRQALLDVIGKGIHVVVASGRPYSCMPKDVMDIPGLSYAISSNGAAVYDLKTGRQLHGYFVPAHAIRQMLAILHEERLLEDDRVIIEMVLHGQAYSDKRYVEDPLRFGASPHALPYIQSTREGLKDTEAFLLDHVEEMEAIDLVIKEADLKLHLLDRMRREIPDLYLTYSVPELIEISHRDAGKHNGIRFLMEYLGLEADEVAAFGDADNDVDMLSFAGTAVAMGNAEASCLAVADYVTLPHWQDGVAYAIHHYLCLTDEKRDLKP